MKKVLIFVEEIYEDLELWYPKIRLDEAGFKTTIAGPVAGHIYKGKHGYPCKAEMAFKEAVNKTFDGVIIPGGYAPDKLRRYPEVLQIVKDAHHDKKLVAFICHGGWVPISAKILKGKHVTSTTAIKDDMENAGAIWEDKAVVVDGKMVTSRTPADLPDFMKAIISVLK